MEMEGQKLNITVEEKSINELYLPFLGHFICGLLFFAFGVHLVWASLKSYIQYAITKKEQMLTFPLIVPSRCQGSAPIGMYAVAVLGIVAPALHLSGFFKGLASSGALAIHSAIFPPFSFASICSLLHFYGYPLPEKTDCLLFAFASANQGILVYSHLDMNWSPMQVRTHLIMSLLAIINAFVFMIEIPHKQSVLAALARSVMVSVHGLWLIHTALTQYTPTQMPSETNPLKLNNDIMLSNGLASLYISSVIGLVFLMSVSLWFKTKDLIKLNAMPVMNYKCLE